MLFDKYLRKIQCKNELKSIRGIDCIYVINLDQCAEKLDFCKKQFDEYGISFNRFPAIYGKDLPAKAFYDIGIKHMPVFVDPLWREWCRSLTNSEYPLDEMLYGKTYVGAFTTKGQIGCSLSHLSIIQDAYEHGYETIWVLEDDFQIKRDPHYLSEYIEELDGLVGKEGWDVLGTHYDYHFPLEGYRWPGLARPDFPLRNVQGVKELEQVGEHFFKICARVYALSLIIRKSAIQKIVEFYSAYNIFSPL